MTDTAAHDVFQKLHDFYQSSRPDRGASANRIIHYLNPFPAKPGSEHDRAQRVTLASMKQARAVAATTSPDLTVEFVKVTLEQDLPTPLLDFDRHCRLERTILDLKDFKIPRPLPLVMDVLTAGSVAKDDIFIFTNADIALVPDFYTFIEALFRRGVDAAIINRRTISGVYKDESDLPLMAVEAGRPHPGFDCFAFRGHQRDALLPYDSCIGIGGVMLPLVHQLLAKATRPVVLLDAHATYHLGDDRQWQADDFADYTDHNRHEIDRTFERLISDAEIKERLVKRLSQAHESWIFPSRLLHMVGGKKGILSRARSAARKIGRWQGS